MNTWTFFLTSGNVIGGSMYKLGFPGQQYCVNDALHPSQLYEGLCGQYLYIFFLISRYPFIQHSHYFRTDSSVFMKHRYWWFYDWSNSADKSLVWNNVMKCNVVCWLCFCVVVFKTVMLWRPLVRVETPQCTDEECTRCPTVLPAVTTLWWCHHHHHPHTTTPCCLHHTTRTTSTIPTTTTTSCVPQTSWWRESTNHSWVWWRCLTHSTSSTASPMGSVEWGGPLVGGLLLVGLRRRPSLEQGLAASHHFTNLSSGKTYSV